ncbi:MAG: hypothetical protein HYT15_03050 [Candidatus Magasanikbacteria bacterium]|nr:hypothetical protein [Candidatus Magasanikbacteria bacterium]
MPDAIKIPNSLRIWFFVHFLVDYAFAVPIFLSPYQTLTFLGWQTVDPISARLFAAALFGIGGVSFISIHSEAAVYKNFLILKIIFSFFAIIGFLFTILTASVPGLSWAVLAIFAVFCLVWIYYYLTIFKNTQID